MSEAESTELAGARVLVTGASGFIGSHLCRRLATLGAEVHGLSRQERRDGPVRWHRGDAADGETVARMVAAARPVVVFHLAGFVSGAREVEAVLPAFRGNLTSTVELLVATHGTGCRLVLAGSLEEPEARAWPPVPSSPYAAAKFAATTYARFFHALYSAPAVVARIFMVYGPDQKDERKLVPYVVRSLLAGETARLSSGERPVDWIYVEDVVEGLLALATAPGVEGRTLDLGSGTLTTVRRVAERLREIVGTGELEVGALPDRAREQVRVARVEETTELTGWRPAVDLGEGLARTVAWYRRSLGEG
jgi:UDP-glucose 4-epimerase